MVGRKTKSKPKIRSCSFLLCKANASREKEKRDIRNMLTHWCKCIQLDMQQSSFQEKKKATAWLSLGRRVACCVGSKSQAEYECARSKHERRDAMDLANSPVRCRAKRVCPNEAEMEIKYRMGSTSISRLE